jgi:hypothetical protein
MMISRGIQKNSWTETCSSATSSSKNLVLSNLGLNVCLRSEKPASNRLSYGARGHKLKLPHESSNKWPHRSLLSRSSVFLHFSNHRSHPQLRGSVVSPSNTQSVCIFVLTPRGLGRGSLPDPSHLLKFFTVQSFVSPRRQSSSYSPPWEPEILPT